MGEHVDTEAAVPLLIIGAGPHALALVSSLLQNDP
jgi:hypothetical protein